MTNARIIDGKATAAALRERVGQAVSGLDFQPGLAVVLVGEDPASAVYVRNKGKATTGAGMQSFEHKLPDTVAEADLLALIEKLNTDASVDGILVQLPLPDHINSELVLNAINSDKDVDGFHPVNVGRLWTGEPALAPCTPTGCMRMIREVTKISGKEAVIVGRSNIVGKPMAAMLLAESATVTIAHSRTADLRERCRNADILVAAVGRPEMIRGDWIKPGAVVIDVGINRVPKDDGKSRLVGDVAYAEAAELASAITPVPGGVGPMTIACLIENTMVAGCRRRGQSVPKV
ncbi:MAG: bifunctional methylenetetrahydrofolate dehydrogenase/methenyltetrahydrofolate cyclohydrolase FolD [Alphaproteobacteria bacterium]|jgi:methylenetetrahydrofolate dehydrogenase (NADP+) / methenyltetrahydrofolate cyclohydrolase|nr:bifunctional methylenetetrahydrofolate dehydrogenase/methenyltetrahydrofolate cyclohydrolase FolD [Alphaproteobacteria bacterium]